jgi:hypothetical protein
MRPIMLWTAAALALAGCESTPNATTQTGAVGIGTLRVLNDQCLAEGHVQGSDAMVACMRAKQAADPATPAG